MTLLDRISSTLKVTVEERKGLEEEVQYTHSDGQSYPVKCYPQSNKGETLDKDAIGLEVRFNALFLDKQPKKNDTILWDNTTYKVEYTHKVVNGCWDVIAYQSLHNTGGRRWS